MLYLENDNRTIVHLDLDSFFVSVERLKNTSFIGKPLIVGGTSDRGVVASCSYEARAFGVRSAMPMRMAKTLCPDAIVIRGDMEMYSQFSNMVTQIIAEKAPLYEKASIDEHYLDITGLDKFFGCIKWTKELRQCIIKNTGLPISFGLSANKTVSKIATGESKPNGELEIIRGYEKGFLSPLSINKIPMVGEKTSGLLKNMGIEKISTLQQMPIELLNNVLGENGIIIWKKANGIDTNPVVPYSEKKSISTEETFDQDTIDVIKLNNIIVSMTEKLAFQLRSEQKLTSCITLKIRYSDFDTHTTQARIGYASCDDVLIEKAKELFNKLYNRRLLVRLIGVRLSHFVRGGYQINLFDDTEEKINLYQAMDKINLKYGLKIHRATSLDCYKAPKKPAGKKQ